MTKLDEIARGMYQRYCQENWPGSRIEARLWDRIAERERAQWRAIARAGLTVLRQPTDEMVTEAAEAHGDVRGYVGAVWQTMVDTALSSDADTRSEATEGNPNG
jgi:hypothetical protein